MVETIPLSEFILIFGQLAVLVFVVCSMLSMGLTLTVPQILGPLKKIRLVVLALVANFILVPAVAIAIIFVFPLAGGLATGLLLVALSAGAPFLPKLAQVTRGDPAFSVGLMVLLMVVTIGYLPLVLPWLLTGAEISAWDIARSLIFLMLAPLVIGLLVRARYEEVAASVAPLMSQASNLALVVLIVAFFVGYIQDLLGVIGSTAILATIVFLIAAFAIGYLFGGTAGDMKRVMGLGTAQRNLGAAVAVAGFNFTDPDVLVMVLVVGLVGLVLLMAIGGELGRRAETTVKGAPEGKSEKKISFG
ncbi:MAG TPA: bile acid:sodium symporter family protein [Methanoculleus sp.]|nr:bile acid:sodium symporter family protein [Methanoculleus sp.]